MNPKEFSWTEDQQVTVTNPTDLPYKFKVHNKEYELGAHKTAKMPGYIAWVFVYGLSSQICQAEGNFLRWNEEGYRQEYYDRLVKNVDSIMQAVEEEDEPAVNTFDEEDAEDPDDIPADTPTAAAAANALAGDEDEEEGEPDQPAETPPPAPAAAAPAGVKPMTAAPRATALQTGKTAKAK